MNLSVTAQLAALKRLPIGELKQKWRDLMGSEPSAHSRAYIESRLTYRIQELAHGGLAAQTRRRLDALADAVAKPTRGRGRRDPARPVSGTILSRMYQGIEYRVIVRDAGFEFDGQRFNSLSAIAKRITGTQWNGKAFFGLVRR
jgi:hypothetical protein